MRKWALWASILLVGALGGQVFAQESKPAPSNLGSLPVSADGQPADLAAPAPPGEAFKPGEAKPDPSCAGGEEPKPPLKVTWGGQFRVEPNSSNFPFQPVTIPDHEPTQSFVAQRFRLWTTVNPNENVEGYLQLQYGGILWGDNYDFSKTFNSQRFPLNKALDPTGDQVGVVLRRAWLAYTDDHWGKVRVGILDWHDSFGDTLASSDYDFNLGGIDWTKTFKELNNLKIIVGAFILDDLAIVSTEENQLGAHDAALFTFDIDQPIGEKSSVGGSVYFISDLGQYSYPTIGVYKSSWDVWVGLHGKTELMDWLPVNGFGILNSGGHDDIHGNTDFKHTGFALKAEAGPLQLGPGKLSVQTIYASGSDHPGVGNTSEFRTVAQSYRDNFGAQGYWSYLHITSPNGPSDVNDLGVSLQDRGLGLFTVMGQYEWQLCPKLVSTTGLGWLRSANRNPTSLSSNIGTEICQMFTYDFGGGLKLNLGASYLFTGDFYKPGPFTASPSDLWELFSRLQLEF